MPVRPLTILLALVPAAANAAAPPASVGVRAELLRYYADQGRPPAWQAAVRRLAAREQSSRVLAANYLLELLAQTRVDERAQMEPWEAEPYQGSASHAPAHQLRGEIAG